MAHLRYIALCTMLSFHWYVVNKNYWFTETSLSVTYLTCICTIQQHGLQNKIIPLSSKLIGGSVWKKMMDYKYADYDVPLTILGDFYSTRKEEQNKFLLDVCFLYAHFPEIKMASSCLL